MHHQPGSELQMSPSNPIKAMNDLQTPAACGG